MTYIFNGHTDVCENIDEKRARGITHVLKNFHIPIWEKGNVRGGFYPIWMNPDLEMPLKSQANRIISALLADLEECCDVTPVKSHAEYCNALNEGKFALFMGAEGLSFIGTDISELDRLYALGFRSASLTWNEKNALACGAGTKPEDDTGLSEAGKKCVAKMEELNMLIDLAHTSRKSFFDIAVSTDGPLMISHGNCAGLCDVPRNYSDEQLRIIAERDGVIGISAYPPFLCSNSSRWDIGMLAEHIHYAVNVAGEDHVGLGFDIVDYLDDYGVDPSISYSLKGMENEACAQNLVICLKSLGMTEDTVEKIFHKNFERLISFL